MLILPRFLGASTGFGCPVPAAQRHLTVLCRAMGLLGPGGYPRGTPIHYKGAKSGANGTAISGNEGELSVAERSNSKP